LHTADFNLEDVLATLDILRGRAEAKGLSLAFDTAPGVPPALHGDGDRLRQVLINLLGNAIKFTSAGQVDLSVEMEASADLANPVLRFQVTDTGPGIPAKRLAQIFESFTQADSSIAHNFGGTGLGLSISRNLVQMMGGRLEVSSEEGKGSVFAFAIPFAVAVASGPCPAVAALSANPAVDGSRSGRILLAEDSRDNQLLILAYLQGTSYQIEVAEDGKAATEKFTSGAFDLVLMDVQMPVMDGYTATRYIREWEKRRGTNRVPILALTANAMADEAEKSRAAGCDAHLTKPIAKAALRKAVSDYVKAPPVIRVKADIGIEELVPGYLNSLRSDLRSLSAALQASDYSAIATVGHQMKGCGAGYGFAAVTDIGRQLETAAKAATEEAVQTQIRALADFLQREDSVRAVSEISAAI
jgi:CheY-like chemotaxis protein/HPt (histidine-containing phosphotransfer) domain-containing protein